MEQNSQVKQLFSELIHADLPRKREIVLWMREWLKQRGYTKNMSTKTWYHPKELFEVGLGFNSDGYCVVVDEQRFIDYHEQKTYIKENNIKNSAKDKEILNSLINAPYPTKATTIKPIRGNIQANNT